MMGSTFNNVSIYIYIWLTWVWFKKLYTDDNEWKEWVKEWLTKLMKDEWRMNNNINTKGNDMEPVN